MFARPFGLSLSKLWLPSPLESFAKELVDHAWLDSESVVWVSANNAAGRHPLLISLRLRGPTIGLSPTCQSLKRCLLISLLCSEIGSCSYMLGMNESSLPSYSCSGVLRYIRWMSFNLILDSYSGKYQNLCGRLIRLGNVTFVYGQHVVALSAKGGDSEMVVMVMEIVMARSLSTLHLVEGIWEAWGLSDGNPLSPIVMSVEGVGITGSVHSGGKGS
ncbi:hypothetical protein Tco_0519972 [Tanacetum coccineum]